MVLPWKAILIGKYITKINQNNNIIEIKMEFRKLGNTDLELSAITYGAFAIGGNMWEVTRKRLDRICKSIN